MQSTNYDICVIGAGRVGLPLALTLAKNGFRVATLDRNLELIASLNKKEMPFEETGCQEILNEVKLTNYATDQTLLQYPDAATYIITVGTPLLEHIEVDISQVTAAIQNLIEKIDIRNRTIILRSTIAPNTTEIIRKYIEQKTKLVCDKDFYLAFCPERIAEGFAIQELYNLPQIIGVTSDGAYEKAASIFSTYGTQLFRASYIEAELAKLFCNIYRYINFSIPNYFTYLSDQFGADVFDILKIANTGYPRNNGLKLPGFAGGICLVKDWGQINESFPQTDITLQAYKINQFTPKMYVDILSKKVDLTNKTVGVLGYTAKRDVDDTRDALTPKLLRYLQKKLPEKILINDPNLPLGNFKDTYTGYEFNNISMQDVIANSEVVIIAMNHSEYEKLTPGDFDGLVVLDGWNIVRQKLLNDFRK